MIKDSFLLFGNFTPIQMFSSVHLNYSNIGSSALGKDLSFLSAVALAGVKSV